jgi:hypothetical protein
MNDIIQNFLLSRFPITGLAAYSIRSPRGVLGGDCFSKSLYPTSTEEMLSRVVQSGRELLPANECAVQYCWTFEAHRVYVASRADGICLALLVENNPGVQQHRLQETLRDFLELQEL